MIKINLLNSPRISNLQFVFWLLILFLLTLCLHLYLYNANRQIALDLAQFTLPNRENSSFSKQIKKEDCTILQGEIEIIDDKLTELTTGDDPAIIMTSLISCLPEKIQLTKITKSAGGKILIEGESIEYGQITHWITELRQLSGIQHVYLQNIQGADLFHFTIQVNQGGEIE